MGILPHKPSRDGGPPPLVAYWRDIIRSSRVGRWVLRHRNATAAVAALWVVSKAWKWLIVDLIRYGTHPGAAFRWATHHVVAALVLSAAVFVIAFVASRLGIDWFSQPEDGEPAERPRPRNRHAETHVPGGA